MSVIHDFTDPELDVIKDLLQLRFKETVEVHRADVELRLNPSSGELTECPAVFWQARSCSFVVVKTASDEFRCQFFYEPADQFSTGKDSYEDIGTCVSTLLQVQSDSEREREGVISGSTGEELQYK
jgi:hypothetical protein